MDWSLLFKISGVIGLLCITAGVIIHSKKKQDIFFLIGGVFLLVYSASIRDWIFIVLQAVFTGAVMYDMIHSRKT